MQKREIFKIFLPVHVYAVILEETKGMTCEEVCAYFHRAAEDGNRRRTEQRLCRAEESSDFADAQTEVDSRKKIQQINKFRWKEDSKSTSFTTRY